MAGSRIKKGEKMAQEMLQIFVVVQVFHQISTCVASVESSGQAFIQTDNELRFMGVKELVPKNFEGVNIHDDVLSSSPILFDPPMLDFHEQPVGMPHMEQVTIQNADTKNKLHLLSLSGSTLHFHCSFFQDKYVPPGGNTTFEVVFLARQVGNVENTLYIHTSEGSFKYQVFGVGVANPYRIRPFLGAKVPVNSSFSPLIHMHNPHGSTLQVEEIYTSGGDLHLELPTGETEATRDFWEIPPYHTKPIMKASFVARSESNHTSFIRIRTNKDKKDQVLILPVEVEVSSAPGIYSTLEMLDFGIVRSFDEPKVLKLNLLNSGEDAVHISEVVVEPPNSAVDVEFRPVQLKPDILQPTPVATISYSVSKAQKSKSGGHIIVRSKSGQYQLYIPYQASILDGSIAYDRNKTLFYTGHPQYRNISRELPVTNAFQFVLVVHNATVPPEMEGYFTVETFKKPIKIEPQETVKVARLLFHPNATHLHFTTTLLLHTNASTFSVPLYVYNGRLKVIHHRPEIFKGQLDFGTMGVGEARNLTFTLRNDNPLEVLVREFSCNMKDSDVLLLGVEAGNSTMLRHSHNLSHSSTTPLVLKPHHFAVFSVNLKAPSNEGTFAAEVIVATQFDYLYIPMTLRTTEGTLKLVESRTPKLLYEKCFPGKNSRLELHLHSSFPHHMEVRDITFNPNDTRFHYIPPPKDKLILLEPGKDNYVGHIVFDMRRECGEDCYVGLPTHITAGHHWLLGCTLNRDVADIDQYLYTRLQQKWHALEYKQSKTINVTIQLDTNQVRGFLFPAQAHLHWPSMISPRHILFPLTQIGNISKGEVIIENPGDVPVMMQLLPLSLYPNPQTILDMVGSKLKHIDLNEIIETDNPEIFTLQDLETYQNNPNNRVPALRKYIETTLGVRPHPETLAMLVAGRNKIRISVGFTPVDDVRRTSLIVLRNNLTIVDLLIVQGQGGRGEMKFSNKKAGSQTPLQFELSEKHLKNCQHDKSKRKPHPNFTVKRSFTARNTGQLPFYVQGFSINGVPCEGFGFKVLDCTGFELEPNSSRKVEIAFTPDFTMSRIRRVLVIHTSLGPDINYTLQATLPPYMLTKCAAALPRPSWEGLLYYTSVGVMGMLVCCVVVAAYLEADRMYTIDIMKLQQRINLQQFDKSKVFDLARMSGSKPPDMNGHLKSMGSSKTDTLELSNGHTPIEKLSNGKLPNINSKSSSKSVQGFLMTYYRKFFCKNKSKKLDVRFLTPERQNSTEMESSNLKGVSDNQDSRHTASQKKAPDQDSKKADESATANGTTVRNNQSKQPDKDPLFIKLTNSKKQKGGTKRQFTDQNQKDGNQQTNSKAGDKSKLPGKKPEKTEQVESAVGVEEEEVEVSSKSKKKGGGRAGQRGERSDVKILTVRERERVAAAARVMDTDDTSSTTTESSLDVDPDKNSSARDSTPEPQPPKKKAKGKKRGGGKKAAREEEAEEDFIITSKSKAHKNIRVDPKNACGGDIFRPSTLELPYTTKLEADAKKMEESFTSHTTDRMLKKTLAKRGKNKGSKRSPGFCTNRSFPDLDVRGKESPPPAWDSPGAPPNDLSEMSRQTALFEARLGRGGAGEAAALSASSRSSSYSSVVSTGGGHADTPPYRKPDTAAKHRHTYTPPAPTAEHKTGLSKAPGNMAPRPASNPQSPRAWNLSPGIPATSSSEYPNANSFGLDTISLPGADPMLDTKLPASSDPAFNMDGGNGEGLYNSFNTPLLAGSPAATAAATQHQQSMMQKLLADRRKRQLEYQQKLIREEWPGFNVPMQQPESLWDSASGSMQPQPPNPASNAPSWSALTDAPPAMQASPTLWGESGGSSWNTPTSIWGGASVMVGGGDSQVGPATAPMQANNLSAGFDPFSNLNSIWNPAAPAVGVAAPSTWGFQPPKPDDDEDKQE